jgi:hypothetical protein
MGLEKSTSRIHDFRGEKVLGNIDAVTKYEYKIERGFTYFNLNGGDSWGYYHPVGEPDIIHNFKGEPKYRTCDLLPEYYKEITGIEPSQISYFAFRNFASDQYFNGWYDSAKDRYTIAPTSSVQKINHFLRQHGQPVTDWIEDWNYEFDFENPKTISFEERWLNKYQPTDIMRNANRASLNIPPGCKRIIQHVCNGAVEFERYINWLAAVLQYRRITKTAWIFNGVEGTGKGIMFHNILSPIIGKTHCIAKTIDAMEDGFNGYLEECVFLMLDEFRVTDSKKYKSIVATIKNLIVEPSISVRHMRQVARMVRNFVNLIIASNEQAPMYISPTDRRFNVGNYQTIRLMLSNRNIAALEKELIDFAGYLLNYSINNEWLQTPLENAARQKLQDLTQTTIDECIQEIKAGRFSYFLELLPTDPSKHINPEIMAYKQALLNLYTQYKQNPVVSVSRDQLHALFQYAVGGLPVTPAKFTKLVRHHGLDVTPIHHEGRTIRGIKTKLYINTEEAESVFKPATIRRIK